MPPCASEQAGSEHTGIVNRGRTQIVIAEARSRVSGVARKRDYPTTRTVSNVQVTTVTEHFEGIQECLTDQRCPDDDRLVFCVMATATQVIEMICPGIFFELWRLPVLNKPLEHARCFVSIIGVACECAHLQVTSSHVSPALCRRQRFDSDQRTQADWGLSDCLLQEPLEKFDSKRQRPPRGGQPVERFALAS